MKIILIAVGILLIEMATSAIAQPIASAEFNRVEQRFVIQSVIRIENATRGSSATGFVVRERNGWKYIITNAHVTENGRKFNLDFYPHHGMDTFGGTELLASDVERDLALLRVKSSASTGALPLVMTPSWSKNELGFRVGFPNSKLKCEEVRLVDIFTADGRNQYGLKGAFLRMEPGSTGGASGSPVVTKRGGGFHVVGVHRGSDGKISDACFEIGQFLKQHGYEWLADGDVTEDDVVLLLNVGFSMILDELEQ